MREMINRGGLVVSTIDFIVLLFIGTVPATDLLFFRLIRTFLPAVRVSPAHHHSLIFCHNFRKLDFPPFISCVFAYLQMSYDGRPLYPSVRSPELLSVQVPVLLFASFSPSVPPSFLTSIRSSFRPSARLFHASARCPSTRASAC